MKLSVNRVINSVTKEYLFRVSDYEIPCDKTNKYPNTNSPLHSRYCQTLLLRLKVLVVELK